MTSRKPTCEFQASLGYMRLNPASKEKKKKEAEEGEDVDNSTLISHLPWLALWGGSYDLISTLPFEQSQAH